MNKQKVNNQKIAGIYKIVNKCNGKIYIGQSSDIYGREVKHRNFLKNNTHHNRHLQYAWNKYGPESFAFSIIEECDLEQLDSRENYWINFYDSYNTGYNLDLGGDGIRGYKHTAAEIDKMRKIQNPAVVLQFDLSFNLLCRWDGGTSHIIKEYRKCGKSITKASLDIRCRHLVKDRDIAYKNSYWVYEEEYNSPEFSWDKYLRGISVINLGKLINFKPTKPIIQYDKDLNQIYTWTDLGDILNAGYDPDRVRRVCNHSGGERVSYGYIWVYADYDFSDGYFDDFISRNVGVLH